MNHNDRWRRGGRGIMCIVVGYFGKSPGGHAVGQIIVLIIEILLGNQQVCCNCAFFVIIPIILLHLIPALHPAFCVGY